MSADKSCVSSSENPSENSAESSVDKKALFAKLLKVHYPLSQDTPSPEVDEVDSSKMSYNERIDALIEKYKDSY